MNKFSMVSHPAAAEWTPLEWMLQAGKVSIVQSVATVTQLWGPEWPARADQQAPVFVE